MSEKNSEYVSALVDDELDGPELQQTLEHLAHSAELRAQWSRHTLIGDALHGNLSAADSGTLQARVWQALEQEPTVLAPPRKSRIRPLVKHAVGVAIAASVAAIAILTIPDNDLAAPETAFAPQLAQANRSEHALVQLTATGTSTESSNQQLRDRLNPYLVNHNEYSVSAGMHGVLPYARLVSQENTR